jgi:hypothetical protein
MEWKDDLAVSLRYAELGVGNSEESVVLSGRRFGGGRVWDGAGCFQRGLDGEGGRHHCGLGLEVFWMSRMELMLGKLQAGFWWPRLAEMRFAIS